MSNKILFVVAATIIAALISFVILYPDYKRNQIAEHTWVVTLKDGSVATIEANKVVPMWKTRRILTFFTDGDLVAGFDDNEWDWFKRLDE